MWSLALYRLSSVQVDSSDNRDERNSDPLLHDPLPAISRLSCDKTAWRTYLKIGLLFFYHLHTHSSSFRAFFKMASHTRFSFRQCYTRIQRLSLAIIAHERRESLGTRLANDSTHWCICSAYYNAYSLPAVCNKIL